LLLFLLAVTWPFKIGYFTFYIPACRQAGFWPN